MGGLNWNCNGAGHKSAPELKDWVVLEPRWIADALACVIGPTNTRRNDLGNGPGPSKRQRTAQAKTRRDCFTGGTRRRRRRRHRLPAAAAAAPVEFSPVFKKMPALLQQLKKNVAFPEVLVLDQP